MPQSRYGGSRWWAPDPAWQGGRVSDSPVGATRLEPVEPGGWLTLPDVAERLDVSISKVHQMIRDRELLAVQRDGVWRVPSDLVGDSVRKHLSGVLTLLHDAGYSDEEALRWLYQPDDTLPGTPAAALARGQAREIKRRAQALGF